MGSGVSKRNVGRIAERIVANELEFRGYRVFDLNKEGLSTNADLIASLPGGRALQIQVKGATNDNPKERLWVQYGHGTDRILAGDDRVFNRHHSFYSADVVALVAVRSPSDYECVLLPWKDAEKAVQLNLDRSYRRPKRDGGVRKPGKLWVYLDGPTKPKERVERERKLEETERGILAKYRGWRLLDRIISN